MVPKGDGLGALQVREAGHDGVGFPLGQVHQRRAQPVQFVEGAVDGATQVKADVRRHLVVA